MQTQTIKLDMVTGGVPRTIHISQYDTGARTLIFELYASTGTLDLTGAIAKISGRKPDGLGFEYNASLSDNVVTVDCTEQMTVVAGIVNCAITLTDSDGIVQSARFNLDVKAAPLNDDTIISDSDFPMIQQAIELGEDAEAWAVGQRNGEDVPSTDETYHNNAKYYAEIMDAPAIQADLVATHEMGAKNLNSYPYYETSHTDHGVVWTDNGDGTVTANGTATGANSDFNCHYHNNDTFIVPKGTYTVTGCPADGAYAKYYIQAGTSVSGTFTVLGRDVGDGVTITLSEDTLLNISCRIVTNYTASDLTFKPMLRLASISDDTYVPYAATNRQLTNWTNNRSISYTAAEDMGIYTNFSMISAIRVGRMVTVFFSLTASSTGTSSYVTIATGLPAARVASVWTPPINNNTGGAINAQVTNGGVLRVRYGESGKTYQSYITYITLDD